MNKKCVHCCKYFTSIIMCLIILALSGIIVWWLSRTIYLNSIIIKKDCITLKINNSMCDFTDRLSTCILVTIQGEICNTTQIISYYTSHNKNQTSNMNSIEKIDIYGNKSIADPVNITMSFVECYALPEPFCDIMPSDEIVVGSYVTPVVFFLFLVVEFIIFAMFLKKKISNEKCIKNRKICLSKKKSVYERVGNKKPKKTTSDTDEEAYADITNITE